MATETQIGKIFIDQPIYDKDNRFGDPRYNRGGAFIEDFQSHVWLEFCERWLHLAGYADLIDDIKEYYNTIGTLNYPMTYRWENHIPLVSPIIKVNEVLPIPFYEIKELEKPFIKYKEPNFDRVKEALEDKKMNGV